MPANGVPVTHCLAFVDQQMLQLLSNDNYIYTLILILGSLPSGLTRRRPRPVKAKEEIVTTPPVKEEKDREHEVMDTSGDKSSSG